MSRYRTPLDALQAQLLFVEVANGSIVVDCLVHGVGNREATLATFKGRRPSGRRAFDEAVGMLTTWANGVGVVDVSRSDDRRRPGMCISSSTGRVVLEPETNDPA